MYYRLLLIVILTLSVIGILYADKEQANTKSEKKAETRESITPLIAQKFGEVIEIEGELVPKGNSYFEQNIIEEQYLLKVFSVNGKTLQDPVVIESSTVDDGMEPGVRYQLKAYETLYAFGTPRGWDKRLSQFNYGIHHRLVIKEPRKVAPKQK